MHGQGGRSEVAGSGRTNVRGALYTDPIEARWRRSIVVTTYFGLGQRGDSLMSNPKGLQVSSVRRPGLS